MDKYTGKRLDARYEIQELIGVGGMAVVYRAYDIIEDKTVAIKILKDEFLGNKEFIRRFKNESKAISVLSHPNIVKVYDVSFGTKIQYIVMEYINGITMKEFISQQKKISCKDAIYFTKQILSALQHAHKKGVVHRDIKPQNIMLLKDGTIKVTDFGIARFSRSETQTMTDRAIGSVHYISPEQAKGSIIDEKADIYSVGVVLYEMLTGQLPFEADNAVSVAIMQMQSNPKSLREINPDIPEGLEEITLHAMQKLPENRYASAEEMLEDIEKFEKNPDIHFNYATFTDEDPTRCIGDEKDKKSNYGDKFNRKDEKKKKSKFEVIAAGIAAAVGLFALIFVFMTVFHSCGGGAKDVDVPDFRGKKFSEIQNSYNFAWKVEPVYDPSKPEGIIIDQDPLPGSKKVKEGASIMLKVNSSGVLVTVPIIKGLSENVAKAKLANAGLKSETLMIVDNDTPEGVVCGSDPQEGTKVTADSTVKLYVSKGPSENKVVVPDVIGKSLSAAKGEISSSGLKVSENIVYESSDTPKDTVISTDPLPGISVGKDTAVKLTVSNGVKKEKNFEISVDLPASVNQDVTVKVYIDGRLDSTSKVNPSYRGTYSIYIKGSSGKKTVNIDLDGQQYRVYEVDFDASSNNVKRTKSYNYELKSEKKSSATDEAKIYSSSV